MKNIKKILIFILLTIFILPITIYANNEVILKVDKTELEVGDVITVDAEIPSDIKLYALTATLNYDKDVFEEITDQNFVGQEDVVEILYNPENSRFGLINKAGEIPNSLFTIRLRVKKDAKVGNTNITLTNIESSDGAEKTNFNKANLELLVTRDANQNEEIPTNNAINYEDIKEEVIEVFTNRPIVIGASIGTILLLGSFIYLIVKKREKKIIIITGAALATFILLLSALLIFNDGKKDVNNDGKKDYDDAREILEYLINMQGTKPESDDSESNESNNSNNSNNNNNTSNNNSSNNSSSSNKKPSKKPNNKYDVNNDGKIDVNDAGHSAGSTTENTNYKVTLKSKESNDNLYTEKGEITLSFTATVSPTEKIKEVMIDGTYYAVTNNNGYYTVKLKTPSSSGVHEFKFTKAKLINNREIKTELTIVKEVLKDEPYVDQFNFDDQNDVLSFILEDKDNAFKNGYIVVEDQNNTEVLRKDITKGNNSISYEFIKEQDYNILIFATFDRDTNDLNNITGNKNEYENKSIYSHTLSINSNYDFRISNVSITDAIEKGKKPVLEFTSTNNKGYTVEYIEIAGHRYEVTPKSEKNRYQVTLNSLNTDTFGKYHIEIDKVEINNYKVFENKKDYELNPLSYTVLKNAPKVENITIEEDKTNNQLYVNYHVVDPEKTIEKVDLSLYDSNNKLVNKLYKVQNGNRIPVSYENNITGGYKVIFLGDYNLGTDRHNYNDVNIGENSIITQKDVKITKVEVGIVNNNKYELTPYPNKNQSKYQIRVHINISAELMKKYNRISGVTINGLNYDGGSNSVNASGDGNTTVTFAIPVESGIIDLNISRVKLAVESYQGVSQAFFAVEPYHVKIDVLKDKPTINDLKIISENYETGEVTFRFYVKDDKGGFDKGTVTLNNETKDIKFGENEITFTNVPKDQELDLIFKGNYDLDTNTISEETNKNYYTDTEIYKTTYALYDSNKYDNIKLTNIKTNSDNNDNYFEKTEPINLSFSLDEIDIPLNIAKIVVEGKEYNVTKIDNTYNTVVEGYNLAGVKELVITDIILSNGRKISLKDDNKTNLEVLKDKISIYDYKYEDNDENIKIKLNLKDNDKAVPERLEDNIKVELYNESNELIHTYPFAKEITIPKDGNIRYYVKVIGTYDRDIKIGENNYFANTLLLNEVISLDKNYIEMKKITDVILYKNTTEKVTEIETVDVNDIEAHPENYFVKINMEKLPTVYAKIKKVLKENNHLILVLDYEYVVKEKNDEKQDLRIDFGLIEGTTVTNSAHPANINDLIEMVKKDPSADINLAKDIDLSIQDIDTDTIFDVTYTGNFNGNGYKIKNLDRPLFKSVKNGTIKNLKLDTVTLKDNKYQGAIANTIDNATLETIIIDKVVIDNTRSEVGGLVGTVTNNSNISKSKITNVIITGNEESSNIGGLVGKIENSTMENNFVGGTITANADYIGGLAGNAINTTFKNNVIDLKINNGATRIANISCYFACSESKTSTIIDNVTINGKANNGLTNNAKEISNNFNLYTETEPDEVDGVTNVKYTVLDESIIDYYKKAHFNEKIWYLKNVLYFASPIFVFEQNSVLDLDSVIDEYDEEKEYYLYANLTKLTPFYDSNRIIKNSKNISDTSALATKTIKHLIPLDANGNIVTYLTTSDYRKITKIKIVYEDNKCEEYEVKFDKLYDMVASYRISALKIDYTFNHYLIDSNSQLVNNLTNYLAKLNYETNLDPLTPGDDSRLYNEFYNDVTKRELKEYVLKYISITNNANANSNEAISDYLEREIKNDPEFIKTLYVYNYFRRFYDVDIDGMKLYDFILFNSNGYAKEMTTSYIVDTYLKDSNNFATNRTSDVYGSIISKYTGYNTIPLYLEHLVTTLTNEDPADWFAHEFKGYLVELNVTNHPEIEYRLWDHIKTQDKNTKVNWYNYALPILTLPEKAAYIITTPGQFIIGAERTYINDPFNAKDQEDFKARVLKYTTRMSDYYNTAAAIIDDAQIFNNIHTVQIDKRFAYQNGVLTYQNPYSTEEPFHKNFNEVVGQWAYPDGNAATANGAYIIWRAEGCLDGDWTYSTWSHETAHNMDARLFLKDNARRFDAGGEDYADGNLTQSFNDHDIVMNLSYRYESKERIAANLTPARINTKEKIFDFYNKAFETIYIMDYLEGEAFLKLPVEEQAALVVQAIYPKEKTNTLEGHEYLQRQHTVYTEVSLEEYKNWNIKTLDDLYDHHLVMFPGVIYSTYTTNKYGGENILKVRWYEPHNDYGRPDSYSLKWWAYEMLGYAGYEKGYIGYYSNIGYETKQLPKVADDGVSYVKDKNGNIEYTNVNYKTDLMALRTITGKEDITFKSYRQGRFNNVKTNLRNIQNIGVNDYFDKFYNALHEDAQAVIAKRKEAEAQFPGDSKDAIDKRNQLVNNSKVKNFAKSSAVRLDLYFAIKNGTQDFEGKVYDSTKQQNVKEFVIPE